MKKLRYPSWWWGRFIEWKATRWVDQSGDVFPESQVEESEMEEYVEERHGIRAGAKHVGGFNGGEYSSSEG